MSDWITKPDIILIGHPCGNVHLRNTLGQWATVFQSKMLLWSFANSICVNFLIHVRMIMERCGVTGR